MRGTRHSTLENGILTADRSPDSFLPTGDWDSIDSLASIAAISTWMAYSGAIPTSPFAANDTNRTIRQTT